MERNALMENVSVAKTENSRHVAARVLRNAETNFQLHARSSVSLAVFANKASSYPKMVSTVSQSGNVGHAQR